MAKILIVLWLLTGLLAALLLVGLWRLAALVARKLSEAVSANETRSKP